MLDRSPDLKDPVATTKAVGPAKLEEKTPQRVNLHNEYIQRLQGLVSQAAPTQDTYTIKQGETLYQIAAERGLNAEELMRINGILDATKIQPGQEIILRQQEQAQEEEDPLTQAIQDAYEAVQDTYNYGKSQLSSFLSRF